MHEGQSYTSECVLHASARGTRSRANPGHGSDRPHALPKVIVARRQLVIDPSGRTKADLRLEELSALSALLIGPREGDRAAHSLLLALHRDLTTPTDAVVGAQARIALLRSRSHAAARQSAA